MAFHIELCLRSPRCLRLSTFAIILCLVVQIKGDRDNLNVPCKFSESLNVTTGTFNKHTNTFEYQNKTYLPGQFGSFDYELRDDKRFEVERHYRACVCKDQPCIRLCCPLGEVFALGDDGIKCHPVSVDIPMMLDVFDSENRSAYVNLLSVFGYTTGRPCKDMYDLDVNQYPSDRWELHRDGMLHTEDGHASYNNHEYCVSPNYNISTQEFFGNLTAYLCFQPSEEDVRFAFYPYAMLTSVPFLLATFIVYAILPELRNVHGKSLMCYLMGLAFGYTILAIVQIKHSWSPEILCNIFGYVIYFSFMSAFFWLNVISFDLWWNFRGIKGISKLGESWKYLVYSAYAWGIPLIMMGFCIFMDAMSPEYIPSDLVPGFGTTSCFIQKNQLVEFMYFYLPIVLIIVSNATFFTLTAMKIRRVQMEMARVIAKEDSHRHRKHLEQEKDKYGLFLRLFIVMGVTWSMEAISWAIDKSSFVFYPTDLMNIAQGPLIFVMFVMKAKVKKLLIKRWNIIRGKKTGHYGTSTSGTRSSQTHTTTMSLNNINTTNNGNTPSAERSLLTRIDLKNDTGKQMGRNHF